MRVIPACLRAADTAGLMTTSVLLPMTVALPGAYVAVADVPELVPPVAAVLALEVLLLVPLVAVLLLEVLSPFEPLPQAATTSPAATIAAMTGSREQLRSKPISFP